MNLLKLQVRAGEQGPVERGKGGHHTRGAGGLCIVGSGADRAAQTAQGEAARDGQPG